MRKFFLPLVVILTGCACGPEYFYKPLLDSNTRDISAPEPRYVDWKVDENVLVSFGICGEGSNKVVCVSVLAGKGSTVRFESPSVTVVTSAEARTTSLDLGPIEYPIWCNNKNNHRECTSSEESPVDGPRTKVINGPSITYSFDPGSLFRGADDKYEQGAYFGHRLAGWRRYLTRTTPIPWAIDAGVVIKLPMILVDGHPHSLQGVAFGPVTEKICRGSKT